MKNKALILAGGLGVRMGKLSKNLPKCLLKIGGRMIIHNLVNSLIIAGFSDIIVSTRREFVAILENALAEYRKLGCNIRIIENNEHKKSAVHALAKISKLIEIKEPFLLLLSDIFYLGNPFVNLSFNPGKDILYGAEPGYLLNKAREGIIKKGCQEKVVRIIKFTQADPNDLRWSGMAICGKLFWRDLTNFIANGSKSTHLNLEDIFQNRVNNGRGVYAVETTNFINVNRPRDLIATRILNYLVKSKQKYGEINYY